MFALAVVLLATDWTWLAAPITAIGTLLVSWVLNRRSQRHDSASKLVSMAETVADMSYDQLDRKDARIRQLEQQLRAAGLEPAEEPPTEE